MSQCYDLLEEAASEYRHQEADPTTVRQTLLSFRMSITTRRKSSSSVSVTRSPSSSTYCAHPIATAAEAHTQDAASPCTAPSTRTMLVFERPPKEWAASRGHMDN